MSYDDIWEEYIKNIKPIKRKERYVDPRLVSGFDGKGESKNHCKYNTPNQELNPLGEEFTNHLSKPRNFNELPYLEAEDFSRLDGNYIKKIRKGDLLIDDMIDLHGCNLHQAEESLISFVLHACESKLRYLMVITGKGKNSEDGISVIRESVPKILNLSYLRPNILAYCYAHKKHGGEGAYYILLKK